MLRPGDHIAKRYRIIRQLGSGGMGAVFEVADGPHRRAVKLVLARHADNDHLRQRFEREARIQAKFDHPFMVPRGPQRTRPEIRCGWR